MNNKSYEIRYLPLFEDDVKRIVNYISETLFNPEAAIQLLDDIEVAIQNRAKNPLSYQPFYPSYMTRGYPYYRIYVGNYVVYYVVINNVMEVRRLLYQAMDVSQHLVVNEAMKKD